MIASAPADILRYILSCADDGLDAVLVTLTGIEGSSSRALGAQMAVAEDGRYLGSFSGGCIEAAVVAEALGALASGSAKLVRFGVNSPYLDIRLPCGGGIDLLFNPRPDHQAIADAVSRIDARSAAALRLSHLGVQSVEPVAGGSRAGWNSDHFDIGYAPALRLVAIGQGDDLAALARLAHGFDADVTALTPDARALGELADQGIEAVELRTRTALPKVRTDPWTAIVFLFHDRDWEEGLLPQALNLPAFYFGAVGSPRTHAARLDLLRAVGVPEHVCNAVRGPIGLIPATRDPATLALSILSEIVQEYARMLELPSQRDAARAPANNMAMTGSG
ncbi:XdhC family protein [Sphingomonas cavernae]|uniref:XdhC family protein n=1 Tax=Sphingomonas cavernae TaxID=2320861 RepID=A0A418WLT6_9SPHN|nr:XdhC family protein [Sphingomonas cavernae]RJF90939.1 XdhC family protein [Sphingomonas cavernae]